jgi:hypothetical protein
MKQASPSDQEAWRKPLRAKRLATRPGAYEAYAEFLTETLAFNMHGLTREALSCPQRAPGASTHAPAR